MLGTADMFDSVGFTSRGEPHLTNIFQRCTTHEKVKANRVGAILPPVAQPSGGAGAFPTVTFCFSTPFPSCCELQPPLAPTSPPRSSGSILTSGASVRRSVCPPAPCCCCSCPSAVPPEHHGGFWFPARAPRTSTLLAMSREKEDERGHPGTKYQRTMWFEPDP